MSDKIDFTKPVRTKDGKSVRILCTDALGCYPVIGLIDGHGSYSWALDGTFDLTTSTNSKNSLENIPPPPREWWVNVYGSKNRSLLYSGDVYHSREDADRTSTESMSGVFRIACVKITEGEGL